MFFFIYATLLLVVIALNYIQENQISSSCIGLKTETDETETDEAINITYRYARNGGVAEGVGKGRTGEEANEESKGYDCEWDLLKSYTI